MGFGVASGLVLIKLRGRAMNVNMGWASGEPTTLVSLI